MGENIQILNLSQNKQEKLFSARNKLSYHKIFHRKAIRNINKKKMLVLMKKPVYLGLKSMVKKQNCVA